MTINLKLSPYKNTLVILAVVFFVFLTVGRLSAQTAALITLDPATVYQTIAGWEVTDYDGMDDNPSTYLLYKNDLYDKIINEVGINRVRLEIRSGIESPQDYYTQYRNGQISYATWRCVRYSTINDDIDSNSINWAGFQFTDFDKRIDNIVLPMKQRLEAKGEKLFINLNYVAFTGQIRAAGCDPNLRYIHNTPDEYAEFILAAFQHMQQKYGFVPDAVEIILEPDNVSEWNNGTVIGNAILATITKLEASGFIPRFIVPSTTSMAAAPYYFDAIVAVLGAQRVGKYISELAYHRYTGVNDTDLQRIAGRSVQYGIGASMLEWWDVGNTYQTLHKDLTMGRNTAWQQGTILGVLNVNSADPNNPIVAVPTATRFMRQYYKYVRSGAQRIGAISQDASFDPIAFVNKNGSYIVVVRVLTGGNFLVAGLPAGTYGIKYTIATEYDIDLADQTIVSGQNISANIPAAGVITIYGKANADTIPPVISNIIPSSITSNSSAITWSTDELSTSQVEYGPSVSYGLITTLDAALLTAHGVNLTNLAPNTTYHYQVRSADAQGNVAISSDNNFMTGALAVTIDWPQVQRDANHSGYVPQTVGPPYAELWRVTKPFPVSTRVQPIIAQDLIFLPSNDKSIYALHTTDGSIAWSFATAGALVNSAAYDNARVFFGSSDGYIYALDAGNGSLSWSYRTGRKADGSYQIGSTVKTAPVVAEGKVFMGASDGKMYALDENTGVLIWNYDIGAPIYDTAAYDNGKIFFGGMNSVGYALDAGGGSLVWSLPMPGQGFRDRWTVAGNGKVFFTPMLYGERNHFIADGSAMFMADRNPALYNQPWPTQRQAILDYFIANPSNRPMYVVDQDTGQLSFTPPILYFGGSLSSHAQPVLLPNGNVNVLYRRSFGDPADNPGPTVSSNMYTGELDLTTGDVLPVDTCVYGSGGIRNCGNYKSPFISDESQALVRSGDIIYLDVSRGTVGLDTRNMILTTPTLACYNAVFFSGCSPANTTVTFFNDYIDPPNYTQGWRQDNNDLFSETDSDGNNIKRPTPIVDDTFYIFHYSTLVAVKGTKR